MLITNFSAGELSPTLFGRVDLQQYYSGASKIKNFDIIPTGGIKRRTGLKRITELHGDCKLIPFIVDKNESYIFECTASHIYVWNCNNGSLKQTLDWEYTSLEEIKQVQYAQNYDTMIIVHKNHKPYQIKKGAAFTISQMSFNYYPEAQINDEYDMVMVVEGNQDPIYIATTDGSLKFNYYKKNGEAGTQYGKQYSVDVDIAYCIVNGVIKYYDRRMSYPSWLVMEDQPTIDTLLFNNTNRYPSCVCFFNNRLFFAATAGERQKVWASAAPDTKGNRYNNFATFKNYVTVGQTLKDPDAHIFSCNMLVASVDVTHNQTTLTSVTQDFTGSVLSKKISAYYVSGLNIPVGTKIKSCTANTIVIDKALSITEDQTAVTCTVQLWRDYQNPGAEDYEYTVSNRSIVTSDCSFNFELASRENDAIKWLASNNYLTIGSESSVWCCPNSITALSIGVENAGHYGSGEMQALCVDKAVVFFAQGERGIREQYFDNSTEGFTTNNIALHAEQMLTESQAIDFDYLNNPYNRLIIVRLDGTAVILLYDKNNGVMAWTRFEHGLGSGTLKNCAVVRGDRQNDIIYFSVKQGSTYYLERYDDNDGVFLDSWQSYSAAAASAYTDNATLFNKTKGTTCKKNSIPTGFIENGDVVYIGYTFDSDIVSLPVIQNDPSGKKRIVNLIVRFYDSYLPKMKIDDLPDEQFIDPAEPYSGYKEIAYPGISDRDVFFELKSDIPYPVNILAVNAKLS